MSDLFTVDYIMFFIEIDRSSESIACTWISASGAQMIFHQVLSRTNQASSEWGLNSTFVWRSASLEVSFLFVSFLKVASYNRPRLGSLLSRELMTRTMAHASSEVIFFFHIFTGYRLSRPPANSRAPCFCSHSICFRESPKITVTGRKSKPSGRRHQLKVFFIPKTKPACFLFQLI